jgi:hypothetical protein
VLVVAIGTVRSPPCKTGMSNVQRVDDSRDVTQTGKENVEQQVGTATPLEEHTERREDDGEDDLANVTVWAEMISTRSQRQDGCDFG